MEPRARYRRHFRDRRPRRWGGEAARLRRSQGKPVVLAFGGDVHFEGVLESKLASDAERVARAYRSRAPERRHRGREPRDRGDERRGADPEGVHVPGARDRVRGARGSGRRRRVDGEQPRARLRRRRTARLARSGQALRLPGHRDRSRRLAGVPSRSAAPSTASGSPSSARRRCWTTSSISAWTAGRRKPGLASAKDVPRLVQAVRAARRTSDTVVVFLHWGVELEQCPSSDQRTLAKQLVAAGADVVVGGHAHRVQGAGRMGEALVGYGLGNFVWYGTSELSTQTGVLVVTVDGRRVLGVPLGARTDRRRRAASAVGRRASTRARVLALAPRLHRPEAVGRGYTWPSRAVSSVGRAGDS